MLKKLMKEKNMSMYKLSQDTGIPYTTINDICNKRTDIKKCNVDTVYKIAKALDTSIEDLIQSNTEKIPDFELFKSEVCHELKRLGDKRFIVKVLKSSDIRTYYEEKKYEECFYLLAMVDHISKLNNIPICSEYSDIRKYKLPEIIYPCGVLALCAIFNSEEPKEKALKEAIPEFLRYNIVEAEIRNVV